MVFGWPLVAAALAAAVLPADAVQASNEREVWYHSCFGVWTQKWTDQIGPIPQEVMVILNRTENKLLKEAVLRHECPFGVALPGEVTWPSPPPHLRGVVNPMSIAQALMVVWSFLPYAVSFYIVALLLIVRGTRQLWVALWLGFYLALNEVIAKKLLKEPRPGTLLEVNTYNGKLGGSCLESCGMPSTHAGITSGLFVLVFLDATFRVRTPVKMHSLGAARTETVMRKELRHARAFAKRFFVLPWVNQDSFSTSEFVAYVFFWFICLYPTSMARVVLFDHTPEQVMIGKAIGFVSAIIWWRLVRAVQHCYEDVLGEMVCWGLLVHNFPLHCLDPVDASFRTEELESSEDTSSGTETQDDTECPQCRTKHEQPTESRSNTRNLVAM